MEPKNASFADHWRVYLGMLIGALLTTAILHVAFPNTFCFLKLWSGTVIGATVGTFATLRWQLKNENRRKRTSGHLLCVLIGGGGLFAAIALCSLVPDMASQEMTLKSVRGMTDFDVTSLSIQEKGSKPFQIDHQGDIAEFLTHMKQATLFYPSHEGSVAELEFTIHLRSGASTTFSGRIPQKHQSDISLQFKGYSAYFEVLLPGSWSCLRTATTKQSR